MYREHTDERYDRKSYTSVAIHCGSSSINAFIVVKRSVSPARRLTANANDLFASEGWRPIQDDLDEVPIFTCAYEEAKPRASTVEMKDQTYTVPFFFCDVDDAQIELEKATAGTGIDGIGLISFPLGKAFQMWAQLRRLSFQVRGL